MSLQQFIFRRKIKRLRVFSKLEVSNLEIDPLGNNIKKASLITSGQSINLCRSLTFYYDHLTQFWHLQKHAKLGKQ